MRIYCYICLLKYEAVEVNICWRVQLGSIEHRPQKQIPSIVYVVAICVISYAMHMHDS